MLRCRINYSLGMRPDSHVKMSVLIKVSFRQIEVVNCKGQIWQNKFYFLSMYDRDPTKGRPKTPVI